MYCNLGSVSDTVQTSRGETALEGRWKQYPMPVVESRQSENPVEGSDNWHARKRTTDPTQRTVTFGPRDR